MKTNKTETLGTKIQRARTLRGISQRDLGRLLGKSHAFIYLIEHDKFKLTPERAQQILTVIA